MTTREPNRAAGSGLSLYPTARRGTSGQPGEQAHKPNDSDLRHQLDFSKTTRINFARIR